METIVTINPIEIEAQKEETIMVAQEVSVVNTVDVAKEEIAMVAEAKVVLTEDVTKLTVKQLKEVAKVMGIKIPRGSKKADIVALIDSVEKAPEETEIDKKKTDAKLEKWDKLVKAVATEYVNQSLNKSWALFYKSTKVAAHKDEYMVKTSKLFGATGKAIETLYGKKYNNLSNIKNLLNVMVIRGYLNFEVKAGNKNKRNVVFYATKEQMNKMLKISNL